MVLPMPIAPVQWGDVVSNKLFANHTYYVRIVVNIVLVEGAPASTLYSSRLFSLKNEAVVT